MKKILTIISLFLISFTAITVFSMTGENQQNEEFVELNSNYLVDTKVNMATEILGTVERKTPEISNGGLSAYPKYNQGFAADAELKQAVKNENIKLNAQNGRTYDSMDEDGNLYLNGELVEQKFYKHSAAESHYFHDVEQSQKAVKKKITIYPTYRTDDLNAYITGLYAPAGEVFKVEMSPEDRASLGEIKVVMGLTSQRIRHDDVPVGRINRMPNQVNIMNLVEESGFFGTYLGGPIYIAFKKIEKPVTFTITGAVEYHHYIHGLTTKEDFERTKQSTAPYFDLMAGDDLIRLSGPRKYAKLVNGEEPSFDDIFKMAKLWKNIATTSNKLLRYGMPSAPITMLYDSYIPAGAALAVQNVDLTYIPCDWLSSALDYDNFVENGSWGNMHEFNHHFQRFGVPGHKEVTNNVVNLMSYGLYTNISAKRQKYNTQLNGWNSYTDPTHAMKLINNGQGNSGSEALSSYTQLLNSFGEDVFIDAVKIQNGHEGYDNWYKAFSKASNYDMIYFFETILKYPLSEAAKKEIEELGLPIYVPYASIYQTGQGYKNADGEYYYSNLTKPYRATNGLPINFDINEDIIIPAGFEIKVLNYQLEKEIDFKEISNSLYEINLGSNANSGKIIFDIELSNLSLGIKTESQLVLQFEQEDAMPEIKVYTYNDETMYDSVIIADTMNFKGYESVNITQSNSPILDRTKSNTVSVIEGKVYIPESGKYLFGIRGLDQILLYTSVNNDKYKLNAFTSKAQGNYINNANDNSTYEVELEKGDYLYYKIVLRTGKKSGNSYGYAEFGMSMYQENSKNESSYNLSAINKDYLINKNTEYQEPVDEEFEYNEKFEYKHLANREKVDLSKAEILESSNANPWGNSAEYALKNAFDGRGDTYFHNDQYVSRDRKFSVTLALDEVAAFNSIEFAPYWKDIHIPTAFKIYIGMTQDDMKLLYETSEADVVNRGVKIRFDEIHQFKYVKIEATKTQSNMYIALSEIIFSKEFDDAKLLNLDTKGILYSKDDFNINNSELSYFGHTYNGVTGGKIKLTVDGTIFGIRGLYGNIKITIDGKEYFVEYTNNSRMASTFFYVENLEDKKHDITIELLGNSSFETFLIEDK